MLSRLAVEPGQVSCRINRTQREYYTELTGLDDFSSLVSW